MSNERERITTPAGLAKYPRLNTPDTKFDDAGTYKITLVLNEKDKGVKEFKAHILTAEKAAHEAAKKQLKPGKKLKILDSVIKPHLDDEGNEVDNHFEVSAKMTASGISKKTGKEWTRKPALFDAKGKPCPGAKVGGGSKVKVNMELNPFYVPALGAGLSLRLEAVQVIELQEYSGGGGNAGSFGFSEEEGYEADESAQTEAKPTTSDDSDDATSEDDDEDVPMDDDEHEEAAAEEAKAAKGSKSKAAKGDF